MVLKNKENSKKGKQQWIITTIAVIDILLGMIMIYMITISIMALFNLNKNPELASEISYNSAMLFAIEIFILMIATFILVIGLLKNKKWAIFGRIILATILIVYYLYNYITGNSEGGNLFVYYNIIVILGLGFVRFKK